MTETRGPTSGPGHVSLTFVPGDLAPASGAFALWGTDELEASADSLGLPLGPPLTLRTVAPDADGGVRPADVPARTVALVPALRRLAEMPPGPDWPAWRRPSPSVLGWSVAAKLALEFVAAGRLVPAFDPDDRGASGRAVWRAAPPDDGRLVALAESLPASAWALRSDAHDGAVLQPMQVLRAFVDAVADACGRGGRRPELDPRRRGSRRPWAEMWADALVSADPTVEHLRVPAEELAEAVREWAGPVVGRRERGLARLLVRLETPGTTEPGTLAGLEVAGAPWRLTLHLQSSLDTDVSLPASEVWARAGERIELGDRPVEDAAEVLVRGLAEAARLFPPLDRVLSEAHPTEVELIGEEVTRLLSDGGEALAAAGIGVQVPPELRLAETQRLRTRIRIGRTTDVDEAVPGAETFSLQDLTTFQYELAIGDDVISASEFAEIVASKQPLVRWRGQWVRIDREEADRLASLDGTEGTLDITEALAAALSGQRRTDDGWVDTVADGEVLALIERLRGGDEGMRAPALGGIEGELRPYQERGIGWLQSLAQLGMGGVLADDMGLGKTVQAIALLTSRRQDRPHLVVCPTSVVGNWEREIRKWSPDVPVIRHHGSDRPNYRAAFRPGHVTVTTYALLRRDVELLEDIAWDVVVFDEAQQIKNASSKGARAARALEARTKVAMTGTPIENRLSELWAIVDVTNPGLLGSQRRFNERFAVPIERWHDEAAADRLRRLVAPFIMRRLKSDPDVAVDLPEKNEITVHCTLTREQASLYAAAVENAFAGKGLGSTTFERRGRILALLTALKQICNHPAQYLRDAADGGPGRLTGRSGKLARASEVLQEIVAAGDRALVFTQFREMGLLLARHLSSELELPEVPFLHGGVSLAQRDSMVARFQDDDDAPPIMLVSLRAGGTGLNLTRATEVMHYDRWWNPAVEQQATDRAHRIGQTRSVTVHTLVTAGTIEERIAELLDRKRALADSVVGEGEAWITELGDDELRDLLALSEEDVEDEEEVLR